MKFVMHNWRITFCGVPFERLYWIEKAEIYDKRQHHARSFVITPNQDPPGFGVILLYHTVYCGICQ